MYECKAVYGETFNKIHRISFLINRKNDIEHVFDEFKTSDHHQIKLNYLNTRQLTLTMELKNTFKNI